MTDASERRDPRDPSQRRERPPGDERRRAHDRLRLDCSEPRRRATRTAARTSSCAASPAVRLRASRRRRASASPPTRTGGRQRAAAARRSSADGRYVAFESFATNLVAGDTNMARRHLRPRPHDAPHEPGQHAALPRCRRTGRVRRAADQRRRTDVAFLSTASTLIDGDTNSQRDIFLRAQPVPTVTSVAPNIACRRWRRVPGDDHRHELPARRAGALLPSTASPRSSTP